MSLILFWSFEEFSNNGIIALAKSIFISTGKLSGAWRLSGGRSIDIGRNKRPEDEMKELMSDDWTSVDAVWDGLEWLYFVDWDMSWIVKDLYNRVELMDAIASV